MITTLIICITIIIITAFICSVYVNIKRQQIDSQKELDEYKTNCTYTKTSSINDIFIIKKLVDKINDEYIVVEANKQNITLIKEIIEPYIEEEDD